MLVQFTVRNVLSFKDEVTLDMTAINAYKEHERNLIDYGQKEKLLRVAAIYGANASGKSNLLYAMDLFQTLVTDSLNNDKNQRSTVLTRCYNPFSFAKETKSSEFQIVEIIEEEEKEEKYEYTYGFEYDAEKIICEWLYREKLSTKRKTTVFERNGNSIIFGAAVRKECDIYKENIPSETLVLSFFNKLKINTTIYRDVYDGICSTLLLGSDSSEYYFLIPRDLPETIDNHKEKLMQFLTAIDTGICDICYERRDNTIVFFTKHRDMEGNVYPLELSRESAGTNRSIEIFLYAQLAISMNKSIFVDELNIKLHPLLLKFIVDLFYEQGTTAQLIYTTHDTTLMDKKFFRRDQLWFVQKDKNGCSELCALSDFKVRSDASFEKDYLAGVYGGIPLLQDFQMKGSADNGN